MYIWNILFHFYIVQKNKWKYLILTALIVGKINDCDDLTRKTHWVWNQCFEKP
jgi:hypothetical protein